MIQGRPSLAANSTSTLVSAPWCAVKSRPHSRRHLAFVALPCAWPKGPSKAVILKATPHSRREARTGGISLDPLQSSVTYKTSSSWNGVLYVHGYSDRVAEHALKGSTRKISLLFSKMLLAISLQLCQAACIASIDRFASISPII